jgi:hypothetical protein
MTDLHAHAEIINKFIAGGAVVWAVVSAVDANAIGAWAAASVAACSLIWSMVREQRRQDRREKRLEVWEDAVQVARIRAINEGKPDPGPIPYERGASK